MRLERRRKARNSAIRTSAAIFAIRYWNSYGTHRGGPHGSGIGWRTAGAVWGHLPQRERSITV